MGGSSAGGNNGGGSPNQQAKDKAAKDKAAQDAKDKAAKDKIAKEAFGNNNTYKTSREIGLTTQYSKTREQDIKEEKEKAFQEQRAYNTRRSIENTFSPIVKIFGPGISEPLQKNAIRTGNFFTDYVLGKGGKKNSLYAGMDKSQFGKLSVEKQNKMYSEYSKNRMSGKIDAYGREIRPEGSGGAVGGTGTSSTGGADAFGPTFSEVSQSEAANADADTEANRLLKIKKKGRSQSIMTGSKGVTKTSTDYSLGKKSLLGRV